MVTGDNLDTAVAIASRCGILRDEHSSATWLLAMIAVSLLITLVLSSAWVQRLFRPLVQPRARWLFRDAGPAASAPGRT